MKEIANDFGVPEKRILYWMQKHNIKRRCWSEATYVKRNPGGDPFRIKERLTEEERALFYIVVGLYLGEGAKYENCAGVALGNTDPLIIRMFLKFLKEICGVEERKIKLELNIYNDVKLETALEYWSLVTELPFPNFVKPVVREARKGNYKHWSRFGTLTVIVRNRKLLRKMLGWCERYRSHFSGVKATINAEIAQLAEHLNGNEEVTGSIPVLGSRNYFDKESITIFLNGRTQ